MIKKYKFIGLPQTGYIVGSIYELDVRPISGRERILNKWPNDYGIMAHQVLSGDEPLFYSDMGMFGNDWQEQQI